MVFKEHGDDDKPTGRSAAFAGIEFLPLQFADLVDKKLSSEVVIPLRWERAKVIESNIPGITVDTFSRGNTTLVSPFSARAIGLVKGGWLPSGLAVQNDMVVMPDRCIISDLKGRFCGGTKKNESDKDFLDLLAGRGTRINPLLYAIEGNLRRNPTPEIIEQQLNEAAAALRSALPEAELVPGDRGGLEGAIGIVRDTQVSMARKEEFLMRLAPKLHAPTSAGKKALLWDETLETARVCGVVKNSLVVLAALSAISVPNGKSPAKRLLKLSREYSTENAYNALADMRSLEILMGLFSLFPEQRLMLCTRDKDLALLWAGMRASDFAWCGDHATFTLSPVDELLPGMTPAQRDSFFGLPH